MSSSDVGQWLAECRASGDFSALIEGVPYARLIGIECEKRGDEVMFVLPPRESNIGNPTLPALHGGLIGGFIEHSAILHLLMFSETPRYPRVVDLSIDYLSAGHFRPTYAECRILRLGRRVANVAVEVWQTSRRQPIATGRAHLLLD
jgi:acyl-coenzyme A thioesterase PaaI-like protein